MSFSFFDLHCDTATELFRTRQSLTKNTLAVDLTRADCFDRYLQVMAFWTAEQFDNEKGWQHLHDALAYLREDPAVRRGKAVLFPALPAENTQAELLLALEDARILNGKSQRLYELYDLGFRILTPLWSGDTCMGGSHNSPNGLSDFGKGILREALQMGMLPDVSHASERSAEQIFELAAGEGRTVMASHSNAYDLCPVSRNLKLGQIRALLSLKGVIGVNLYRHFLSCEHPASRVDVLRHIEYFLEQGCEDALCFGGDMDGADLPADVAELSAIPSLRAYLSGYYSEEILNKLFFENANHFAERNHLLPAKNL